MDKWSGSHRNDLLYNVGVLEMKKADGNINAKDMSDILQKRNQELFVTPMDPKEVEAFRKMLHKFEDKSKVTFLK